MCFELQNLLPHWESGSQTSSELQFQAPKITAGTRGIFSLETLLRKQTAGLGG